MYENILYEVADGIATITLNRPDKLNAYTTAMGDEVYQAFGSARDDDDVRAVILTGAGRGFCAGVDLEHLKAHQSGGNASKGPKLGEEAFLKKLPLDMVEFPKPIIVAINGAAIGVGMTMSLPCDIRIAVAGAKLGLTFAKLGILPGLGSTHLLPRLVGMAKAQELVLTARIIRAEEALAIGLVNAVVEPDAIPRLSDTLGPHALGPPDSVSRQANCKDYRHDEPVGHNSQGYASGCDQQCTKGRGFPH